LIKVPGTAVGAPTIEQLLYEGINVNITLLFGLGRYREVADAYLAGLEARAAAGGSLERVASVASFFLSRIDVLVDPLLEKAMQAGGTQAEIARSLHGQVAIACAKEAYQIYKEVFEGARFRALAARAARTQRPLWASTSTKNPSDSDVKYVEALIGPETVNTLTLETLHAYRDHGHPSLRLEEGVAEARELLRRLPEVGIDLAAVTQQLEAEGVQKFNVSLDRLMTTLEEKRAAALAESVDRQVLGLDGCEAAVEARIAALERQRFGARLWRKDASLWKTDPQNQAAIRNALGWLHVAEKMDEHADVLTDFAAEVRAAGFRHVVHMGMGGSSLAPLLFARTFSPTAKGVPLTVLDTTDSATLLRVEQEAPIAETLFIVASKSGTTAEPLAFGDYFYEKVAALKGDRAGENFAAITDPGTPLAKLAQERGFRRTFPGFPDIGGRYSALSAFGLVPAALLGIDVAELLARSLQMAHACASCVPAKDSPGMVLGAAMGELARRGRDKVTLLVPEPIASLGLWLEQLLAESTGKEGAGLIPIAGEPLGSPDVYGEDRLFVDIDVNGRADGARERGRGATDRLAALRAAGHPVITIRLDDLLDLGQEFFRWELATATAGAVLGINPFDQPNVQESKENTDRLLDLAREERRLPEEQPMLVEGPLRIDAPHAAVTVAETLARFLGQAHPGDYVALTAYLTEEPANDKALQELRRRLRDRLRLATTLGYGPRFLHSTGQLHKGGPNTGLFLQLTADDPVDLPIPGQPYTFGMFKRAQALGDLEALRRHGRRVARIHLGPDVRQGLAALGQAMEAALAHLGRSASVQARTR
jgi:transaldolase/glucose-6-phosphate isomerase